MLNFDFLEKGLGLVSQPNFVHDFLKKLSILLNCINLQISLLDFR